MKFETKEEAVEEAKKDWMRLTEKEQKEWLNEYEKEIKRTSAKEILEYDMSEFGENSYEVEFSRIIVNILKAKEVI